MGISTITPQAGYYKGTSKAISIAFDQSVTDRYAYSIDPNVPLSVSTYIAYDTLSPPNPFLAVTQDGRGRVVYDGGFPKFYNGTWNSATTFAGLIASHKFLHNAISWVASTSKVAAGNKKVLIVGDCFNDSIHYSVKSTGTDGFYTTLTGICAVAGFTPTFKNCSDWSGAVNPRLAELEQYALVIFFGCHSAGPSGGVPSINPASATDFATYRENGGGIILVTDHGINIGSIAEAIANANADSSFFNRVNQVAVKFGAYFTGDYNRTPVNVGFLRSTYGDHPLYNGMTNAESIVAGGSESKVVVTSSTTYAATSPINVTVTPAKPDVNIFFIEKDGSVGSVRLKYYMDTKDIQNIFCRETTATGNSGSNTGIWIPVNWYGAPTDISFTPDFGSYPGSGFPALPWRQLITTGGNAVGVVSATATGTTWSFFNGTKTMPLVPGEQFVLSSIMGPVATQSSRIQEASVTVPQSPSYSKFGKFFMAQNNTGSSAYKHMGAMTAMKNLRKITGARWKPPLTRAGQLKLVRDGAVGVDRGIFNVDVYTTEADCISFLTMNGANIQCAVNATTGEYYVWYGVGDIRKQPKKFAEVFGCPFRIESPSRGNWEVDAAGVFTKVA